MIWAGLALLSFPNELFTPQVNVWNIKSLPSFVEAQILYTGLRNMDYIFPR